MDEIYKDELKKLNGKYVEMGINVSEQIYQSTKAFIDHDSILAGNIMRQDKKINEYEMTLEAQALDLMALKQPVAEDFRIVISILKASSDLERIGDHANSIARETIRIKGNSREKQIEINIAKITANIRKMLEMILDAYINNDDKKARKIAQDDLEIDKQYFQNYDLIVGMMARDTSKAVASSSYLTVIRLLERIGDHIVNLAEWVVYAKTGKLEELNPGKLNRE